MSILSVYKILYYLLALSGGFSVNETLFFESKESKTEHGKEVYNKISLIEGSQSDTWVMKQSHHGKNSTKWDHIKIVVDKTKSPYQAEYFQLDKEGKEIEYKTSCVRCHANGPRYIRPEKNLKISEKLKLWKFNNLIKSYGEVQNKETSLSGKVRVIKLSDHNDIKLNIKSCSQCHYKGGPRSELTGEQRLTIKFLVKNKEMPPWPYKITKEDEKELKKFIYQM